MRVDIAHDLPVSPNLPAGDASSVCDFPSLAVLDDGRVLVVYRQGSAKHSHDGIFVIQSSSDGGRTWSAPEIVFDGRELEPNLTATTGGICQAQDGTLVFAFFVVEGLQPGVGMFDEIGFALPRKIFISLSHDAGASWSTPEPYAYPGMPLSAITEKPFVLPDGEICMPIEYYSREMVCRTALAFSSDGGRTFSRPPLHIVGDLTDQINYGDARFAQLPDGCLLTLLWTFLQASQETVAVHRAWSSDQGRTWTEPASVGFVGQVTNPLALPAGDVLAVSNYRLPPEGIRLWHSPDGGATWDVEHSVQMWDARAGCMLGAPAAHHATRPAGDGDGDVWGSLSTFSFGTPDLVRLDDGALLMSYYAAVDGIIHVRACRFRWVMD
jgi:hypothetical protein